MVFPFEKFLTDNYGFMDPVNFHENVLLDIVKKCSANSVLFCYNNAAPYFLK